MNGRITITWANVSEACKRDCRDRLREAMRSVGQLPHWKEVTKQNKRATDTSYIRIVLNGRKLYQATALPELTMLVEQLLRQNRFRYFRSTWLYLRTAVPALLFAIFPKCPICWAAYASLLSYLGVYLPYYSWMIWVFAGFGILCLALSFRNAFKTGEYRPVALLIAAYGLVTLNRLYWNQSLIVFLAMTLLLTSTYFLKIQRKSFHLFNFKLYGN